MGKNFLTQSMMAINLAVLTDKRQNCRCKTFL